MVGKLELTRRRFLKLCAASGIALVQPALTSCNKDPERTIKVTISGANSGRGHQTWKQPAAFAEHVAIKKNTCIIGAGVSGLSAAYALQKNGEKDLLIVELDDKAGGNSRAGANAYSKYPYGAHYLTLPNPGNGGLIAFLRDKGIITGEENGKLKYNEEDLCFDPEERLFVKGSFQEGLVPNYDLSDADKQEISRFFRLMALYKAQKGADGKFFFDIPASLSSSDPSLDSLDSISFRQFLDEEGFRSESLLWYLDYCCRDDYGGDTRKVSAWAGINYFAAHRAEALNTDPSRVLTWPEGNNRLVELLLDDTKQFLQTGCLVKNISIQDQQVVISAIDFTNSRSLTITCEHCIVAIPPFVASHILDPALEYPRQLKELQHSPWLVAAVTLDAMPEARGMELCWDNVAYKARSLGYIYDQHQQTRQLQDKYVISLYLPLDGKTAAEERKMASTRSEEEWKKMVLDELEIMHTGISATVQEIDIWTWGHGMILPSPGLTKGQLLKKLSQPIGNKIFFAHTDLSAYSIFEEGFDQGLRAAEKIIAKRQHA